MAVCITQEGALAIWQGILGVLFPGQPWCHLLGQNTPVFHTLTYASFAVHEVGPGIGYTPQLLVQPAVNWTLSPIGAGAQAQYIALQWTFTADVTVYGYWIADNANNRSLWAEELATPWEWTAAAPTFVLQLIAWLASAPDVGGIPCTAP